MGQANVTESSLIPCQRRLANGHCKQFGPRSGPTERRSRSGSKPFDTQILFRKEYFEKVNFEKKVSRRQQNHEQLPSCNKPSVLL